MTKHYHEDREVHEGFGGARKARGETEARTHRYISLKTGETRGMLRGDIDAEQIPNFPHYFQTP